jgi:hypothetical protein
MNDALIKAHNSFSDAVRADERRLLLKEADRWIKRCIRLEEEVHELRQGIESSFSLRPCDPVTAMTARKAPSPKLSADECATLALSVINSHTPRTIEEIREMRVGIGRSQLQRGLKLLMEQKRVVCVNQEARRGRKYQLVKEENLDGAEAPR